MTTLEFRRLLTGSLIALALCAGLVTISYQFIDRPVAFFVHNHQIDHNHWLAWLPKPGDWFRDYAPVTLVVLLVVFAFHAPGRGLNTLWAMTVNSIISDQIKDHLQYLFGRCWPETWYENNQSLIQNGAYGFRWFQTTSAYQSFPSGHTTAAFAAMGVIWIVYPRWRWLCVVVCGAAVVGLVGMNYHFVSDCIAGAFLGSVCAVYAVHLCGLAPNSLPRPSTWASRGGPSGLKSDN